MTIFTQWDGSSIRSDGASIGCTFRMPNDSDGFHDLAAS